MSRPESETNKKQFILRLAPSLHRELAAWAQDDFRSLNGQIEYLLSECVRQRKKRGRPVEPAANFDEEPEEN